MPKRYVRQHRVILALLAVLNLVVLPFTPTYSQTLRRKPVRATPPKFDASEFEGIFFDDVSKQLVGPKPTLGRESGVSEPIASTNSTQLTTNQATGSNVWQERISAQSLEDLVKESKNRLDAIVTTPAKFAAGGYKDARREFTLLGILFATIELYSDDVRWKSSSSVARARFTRMAANAKVGTAPAFNEAKLRMEDLGTLLKGSALTDSNNPPELVWTEISDRGPSMQILEWSLREKLSPMVASEKEFNNNGEEIQKYGELVALIGEALHQPGMLDADDEEYQKWSKQMIDAASRVVESVQLSNPTLGREAAGQIDQSCNACHNTFR